MNKKSYVGTIGSPSQQSLLRNALITLRDKMYLGYDKGSSDETIYYEFDGKEYRRVNNSPEKDKDKN